LDEKYMAHKEEEAYLREVGVFEVKGRLKISGED
jgi:hypothetical protein